MSLKPFSEGQGTPLRPAPYRSRISNQNFEGEHKNYVLTGFRPGYALQAAELNEIQENFYLQQTLTTTMISNWSGLDAGFGPGWGQNDAIPAAGDVGATEVNGVTPLSPTQLRIVGNNLLINEGWYLVQIPKFDASENGQDREMNFKVWIYFENGATIDIQGIAGVSNTLLGFDIKQEFITEDEDDTLSDPANGAIANEIPGATRYKLTVDKIVQSPGGGFATAQVPLASSVGEKTPYFAKVVSGTLLYLNGHSVQVG